jgi:hypothetical protein
MITLIRKWRAAKAAEVAATQAENYRIMQASNAVRLRMVR